MWEAGRPPEWHGQERHARGGRGHLLSGPAPLLACQGIKGLLAFVSGSPAPGSLHNKVLPCQIPSTLPSAAHRQGTGQSGGGAGHLDPVSGARAVAEPGSSCCEVTWEPVS